MLQKNLAIIEAPSNLGLRPPAPGKEPGVFKLPEAFKTAKFAERLGITSFYRVKREPYSPVRCPSDGMRNCEAIRRFSIQLAEKLTFVLDNHSFPIVLGGDCSILLGNMLALKRRGRFGLFFLDGHTDFEHPGNGDIGSAAGMDLALVTGRGPEEITNFNGLKPLVRDEDVVVFGVSEMENTPADRCRDIFKTRMTLFHLNELREIGIVQAAKYGIEKMRSNGVEGFWIHLDADIIDQKFMPAVDCPNPFGMTFSELSESLKTLLSSDLAVGIEITIYDPDLDVSGIIARNFTDSIISGFSKT